MKNNTTAKLPHIIILNPDEMRSDVLGHLGSPAAFEHVLKMLRKE